MKEKIAKLIIQAFAMILFTTPFALMMVYGLLHATTLN